jgi:hypothetical protein
VDLPRLEIPDEIVDRVPVERAIASLSRSVDAGAFFRCQQGDDRRQLRPRHFSSGHDAPPARVTGWAEEQPADDAAQLFWTDERATGV